MAEPRETTEAEEAPPGSPRRVEERTATGGPRRVEERTATGDLPADGSGIGPESIPVVEERLHLGRRTVETGRVRLRLRTEIEEVPVQAELRQEALEVERVAIGRELASGEPAPAPREEEGGAVLVVPVLEEVLVVERRLVLAEEWRIRRRVAVETAATTVTRRRQRVEVERLPPSDAAAAGAARGDARPGRQSGSEEEQR